MLFHEIAMNYFPQKITQFGIELAEVDPWGGTAFQVRYLAVDAAPVAGIVGI